MAAKKSAAKKKPAVKAAAKKAPTVAVKILGQLPALDSKLRAAFKASFADRQCEAWGQKTKSEDVQKEAERWISAMAGALSKGPVSGYSPRRLAWLCELVVALDDERARGTDGSAGGAKTSAMAVATRIRSDLIARLTLVAGGNEALHQMLKSRSGKGQTPQHVRDSLTGLIDLANRWRKDAMLALLADDADLSDHRLSAAYDALENLARADLASEDTETPEGQDSAAVNRIEGRVLRELFHAATAFRMAKENGERAPALVPGPGVKAVFGEGAKA